MKEAVSSLWCDVFDVFGGHNNSRKVDEMFSTWLNFETSLPHKRKLFWLTDKDLEGVVVLVKGAKGHLVAVEAKGQPESTFLSTK